jgi:ArsR family transcriptional regulator
MNRCACEHKTRGEIMKGSKNWADDRAIIDLADFYKIFGDSTRLKILLALKDGEITVTDLSKKVEMNQSAVSHQLKTLKQARLVRARREGKNSFYSFDDEHIYLIIKLGIEHISEI